MKTVPNQNNQQTVKRFVKTNDYKIYKKSVKVFTLTLMHFLMLI